MLGTDQEESMEYEESTPPPRPPPVDLYAVPPLYGGHREPQSRIRPSTREMGIQTDIPMYSLGTQTESADIPCPRCEAQSVRPKVRHSQPRRQHDTRQSYDTSDSDEIDPYEIRSESFSRIFSSDEEEDRRKAQGEEPKDQHSQSKGPLDKKKQKSVSDEAGSSRREAERERQEAQRRNRREGQFSIRRKVTFASEPAESGKRKRQSGEDQSRKEQRRDDTQYRVVSTETFAVSTPAGTTRQRELARDTLPGSSCPFMCGIIPSGTSSAQKHFFK